MKADPLPPGEFRKKFSTSIKRAERSAHSCVQKPTSEAVHEARISIRKVMAATSLMPRDFRNDGRTRKALDSLRLFYRACAEVRDIDTMMQTLSEHASQGGVENIIRRLTHRRSVLITRVVRSGEKVEDLRMPRIMEVSEKHFDKRLNKLLCQRAERAMKYYQSAASSEGRKKELHKLRKECRRIMYLLGFSSQGNAVKTAVTTLEDARAMLGSIRNADLLLDVLASARQNQCVQLRQAVSASRHKKYREFFTRVPPESGGPFLLRIIGSTML